MFIAPLFLSVLSASVPPPATTPLVCNVNALTDAQRARHRMLGEKLLGATVQTRELADGYELALDLGRISDTAGRPYCVVEVGEWIDGESRCCPFLDFGIDLIDHGRAVRMRLTGPRGVKELLKAEIPMLAREK
jgi:hypothetical protein